MALAIPTMVAQVYVERATGKLQKLENVNQITLQNQTKYYQINHFYIDKQNISSSVIFEMGSSDGIGAFIIG
jgi:predicted aldo/keto reductase-like oxidoreductase